MFKPNREKKKIIFSKKAYLVGCKRRFGVRRSPIAAATGVMYRYRVRSGSSHRSLIFHLFPPPPLPSPPSFPHPPAPSAPARGRRWVVGGKARRKLESFTHLLLVSPHQRQRDARRVPSWINK